MLAASIKGVGLLSHQTFAVREAIEHGDLVVFIARESLVDLGGAELAHRLATSPKLRFEMLKKPTFAEHGACRLDQAAATRQEAERRGRVAVLPTPAARQVIYGEDVLTAHRDFRASLESLKTFAEQLAQALKPAADVRASRAASARRRRSAPRSRRRARRGPGASIIT